MTSPPKPARPKSAVRRQTVDRDLDMIEGLDFTEKEDLDEAEINIHLQDEEEEIDIHLQDEEEDIDIHLKDEEEEIDIHLHGETDEDELIIDGDNHGEKAANLEVDIVPYEFHDDTGKYYALWG